MPMPSLSQARDVVTSFLSKLAAKAEHLAPSIEREYVPIIARTLASLIGRTFSQQALEKMQDDYEVQRFVKTGAPDLVSWTGRELGRSLSRKLNLAIGAQTHSLFKNIKGKNRPQLVARFNGPRMKPNQLYQRFSTLLKKEGIDMTPEKLKNHVKTGKDYSIKSEEISFYDNRDLKVNASVQLDASISMLAEILSELIMDPGKFRKAIVEQSEMTEEKAKGIKEDQDSEDDQDTPLPTSVAWMRPPPGRTFSTGEESEEKGGRVPIDPRVGRLLMSAMEEKRPVRWEFRKVRTEKGKEGISVNFLDFVLPDLSEKEYSIEIPDEISKGMDDQRPGEDNHFEVLEYDDRKGFKVRFREHHEELRRSKVKTTIDSGITVGTFRNALKGYVSNSVKDKIRPTYSKDVSEVAEKYLRKVLVGGKDIASTAGLDALMQDEEKRLTVADPRGHSLEEDKDDNSKELLDSFIHQKEQQAEKDKGHEEALGKDISKAMMKGDPAKKIADKLADMVARNVPDRAPFTSDSRSWKELNAFRSKDTVRWLVKVIVDSAMLPTKKGAVLWKSFITQLFKSDVLTDVDLTRKLFGSNSLNDFFMAMKIALLTKVGKMSGEEKEEIYSAYENKTLKVSPEERREIVGVLSSRSNDTLRSFLDKVHVDLKNAIIELYRQGDPDVESLINMSHVNVSEPVSKKEKEERGLDPSKRVRRESLRPQMEALRQREKEKDTRDEAYLRDFERLLKEATYLQVVKMAMTHTFDA